MSSTPTNDGQRRFRKPNRSYDRLGEATSQDVSDFDYEDSFEADSEIPAEDLEDETKSEFRRKISEIDESADPQNRIKKNDSVQTHLRSIVNGKIVENPRRIQKSNLTYRWGLHWSGEVDFKPATDFSTGLVKDAERTNMDPGLPDNRISVSPPPKEEVRRFALYISASSGLFAILSAYALHEGVLSESAVAVVIVALFCISVAAFSIYRNT